MFATNNVRRFAHPLLIIFTLLISQTVLTVGLPIPRQEHAAASDLIAGEAFLSILMGGLANVPVTDLHRQQSVDDEESYPLKTLRTSRAQQHDPSIEITKTSDSDLDSTPRIEIRNDIDTQDPNLHNKETEDGTIISVRVSSTIGHSMINKHVYTNKEQNEEIEEILDTTEQPTTTDINFSNGLNDDLIQVDQEAVASEDAPSLIAEANKSEFHVEEMEPISRDYNEHSIPSHQNSHPSLNPPSPIPFDGKTYPGTLIYHNEGGNNRVRSVSYSTVIQALPSVQKSWTPGTLNTPAILNPVQDNGGHQNNTMDQPVDQGHPMPAVNSGAESKDYYVTSKYEDPSRYYSPEPTERNWGVPEQNYHEPSKPYTPVVYGQPEQNYEVDEAVSVETNGRAHGIQPVQTIPSTNQDPNNPHHHAQNPTHGKVLPGKKDDNQKVGYVVEGRNYRKYRVEERTSDGFIVGEYGVVRHDDGSLRGVRYTADGTISPRLIYDALMKFLSL